MKTKDSIHSFLLALQVISVIADKLDTTIQANICNMTITVEATTTDVHTEAKCRCSSTAADCGNLRLAELPAMISFPKGVLAATFSNNHLEEVEKESFYNGKDIVEMDLSHNDIHFVSVEAFAPFKNLRRLILSHNNIWILPWQSFHGIPTLKVLDLSYNLIENLFSDAFVELPALEELKLRANPIIELEPKHFAPLPNLLHLDLESIMLSEVADHLFVHLTKLQTLSLANNLIYEVPTVAFKPLGSLKSLDFSGNPIDEIGPQSFAGLAQLLVLYLDRMPSLKSIDQFAFSDLSKLSELHCNYNFLLSEVSPKAFINKSDGNVLSLKQLFLRQNNLHRLSPRLLKWSRDLTLDLRGNPWDCHCHAQWMIRLKTKTQFQENLICDTPRELQGRSMDSLDDTELPCGMSVSDIATITVASLLGVTLFFTLIGVLIHRKKYKSSLQTYSQVYKHSTSGEDDVVYEKKRTI